VIPLLESGEVVSTWHTHPTGSPNHSGEDRQCFLSWPDLSHIIIGVRDGKIVQTKYRVENGVLLVCN
jgi:proteasome lid subunit RPN8/RPN11